MTTNSIHKFHSNGYIFFYLYLDRIQLHHVWIYFSSCFIHFVSCFTSSLILIDSVSHEYHNSLWLQHDFLLFHCWMVMSQEISVSWTDYSDVHVLVFICLYVATYKRWLGYSLDTIYVVAFWYKCYKIIFKKAFCHPAERLGAFLKEQINFLILASL